jgi:hypothetical protein
MCSGEELLQSEEGLFIQFIPKITSIPCPSRTIKHVLYILPFKLREGFMTTCLVTICPPGVLII